MKYSLVNRPYVYILLVALLVFSCQNEGEPVEVKTLEEATKTIKNRNRSIFYSIQNQVQNKGNRVEDVEGLQNLEEILELMNSRNFALYSTFQDTLLTKLVDEDPKFQEGIRLQLSLLNYYSDKIDSVEISDMLSAPEANWKLTLALMEDRIIREYQPKFGAADLLFSKCCGVNAATNYDDSKVGKSTSVVIQNDNPEMDASFTKIVVMVEDEEIESEVTEMNEILLVNFTPTKKGDYHVKFISSVDSYDTTIIQKMDISLKDIAGN